MKLIKEYVESVKCITEAVKDTKEKQYYIEGVFLQSNLKNKNGRMYPENTMDNEVNRYMKEYVEKNRAYGELGHPESPSINLDRVSHMITGLKKEGTNWIGKAKILETPMGKIARGLLEGGANLGVSSRALGTLRMNKEGVQVVQDDFLLSTAADIVADPSAPDAFVRGIMESVDWIFVDGKFEQKQIDRTKEFIESTPKKRLTEASIMAFQSFLKHLK